MESEHVPSAMGNGSEGEVVAVAPPPSHPPPPPVAMDDQPADVVVIPYSPPPADDMALVVVDGDDVAGEGQAAGDDGGEYVCDICGASYQTEKAMFGHLRCHKDGEWRGAFCPPTFSMDEFAEYQEQLVKSEEDQLREIEAEETALVLPPPGTENAPAAAAQAVKMEVGESSGQKVVLDVDLNAQAVEEAVDDSVLPDLNLPAPDGADE